jgi:hypothetical protein
MVVACMSAPLWSQDKPAATTQPAATQPAAAGVKSFTFDSNDALASWRTVGDVTVDMTKPREGKGGSLKVSPEGKATMKLGDKDGFGKVELYVFDDGSKPDDATASRTGPRWGIVQSDGQALAVGVFYAAYLAGQEGYTASATNQQSWFESLTWLGQNRAPAGWHKWTFNFDPDTGFTLLHNDKPMVDDAHAVTKDKVGIKGFNSLTIWGDSGAKGQTVWADDVTFTPAAEKAATTKPADAK